nr:hypothetical protein [Gimesia benthica]
MRSGREGGPAFALERTVSCAPLFHVGMDCLQTNTFVVQTDRADSTLKEMSGVLMLEFFTKHKASVKDDVLSGLTVALALVPEAVAFAFVAGVPRRWVCTRHSGLD